MAAKKKTLKKKSPPKKTTKKPVAKAKAATKPKSSALKRVASKAKTSKKPAAKTSARSKPAARKKAAPRKAKRPALKPKRTAASRAAPKAAPRRASNPEALALAQRIAKVAVEKKAIEVVIIDTIERASAVGYDYVVVASGDGDRQLVAIADGVDDVLRPLGQRPQGVQQSVDWVSMDYGAVIAHVFTPERRGLVDIEGLWSTSNRVPLET